MHSSFVVTCPKCNTVFRVKEIGEKYPAKCYDPYYCPVCYEIVGYKNTMYFYEEEVISLDDTKEPFKTEYLENKVHKK